MSLRTVTTSSTDRDRTYIAEFHNLSAILSCWLRKETENGPVAARMSRGLSVTKLQFLGTVPIVAQIFPTENHLELQVSQEKPERSAAYFGSYLVFLTFEQRYQAGVTVCLLIRNFCESLVRPRTYDTVLIDYFSLSGHSCSYSR